MHPKDASKLTHSKGFASCKKAILTMSIAFMTCGAMAFQGKIDPQGWHVESALVAVPAIISDPQGRYVPGLKAESFRLFQDSIPAPISLFLTSEDPIKIALVLDTSRSTTPVLGKIKKAAGRFLLQMRPKDLATVISVDTDIQVLCPFSSDARELSQAIKSAKPGGMNTRIRDAIMEIAQKRFRSISGRKAVVLLTDGEDHGSETSVPDLFNGIAASSTLIYSVFYHVDARQLMKQVMGTSPRMPKTAAGQGKDPWLEDERKATEFLEKISTISAGRFYRSDVTHLDEAFSQISDELRAQYLLGFYPDKSKLDGQMHSLEVRVSLPNVLVRSRRSYRSVPNE